MLRLIERTDLEDVSGIDLAWLAREAPPFIADILRALGDPTLADAVGRQPESSERAVELRHLRGSSDAPSQVPRDLGLLHAILIGALQAEVDERGVAELAGTLARLAEIFGGIQATLTEQFVTAPAGESARDPVTGLPGSACLDEWMQTMIAAQRRYGTPFSLLMVDVEGLRRINETYGHPAGDHMLAAVAAVITGQIRDVDRAFRLDDDELCVLLPQQGPIPAVPAAERLVSLVTRAQAADGPRVDISVGIAACPEHGGDAETLLSKAEEASYAAKAAGESVAIAHGARPAWLQDG
jgi:diguanylate cyclase (GGDEF)-like protein